MLFTTYFATAAAVFALRVSATPVKRDSSPTSPPPPPATATAALSSAYYVGNINDLDVYAQALEQYGVSITASNLNQVGQEIVGELSLLAAAASKFAADAQTSAETYADDAEQAIVAAYVTLTTDVETAIKTIVGLQSKLTAFAAPIAASLSSLGNSFPTLASVVSTDVGAHSSTVVGAANSLSENVSNAINAYGGENIGIGV